MRFLRNPESNPMKPSLCLETDPDRILNHLDEIIELANSERSGLGFLTKEAMKDGIERGKMLALLHESNNQHRLAGYLLYGGVFPNAKVQQIATAVPYRGQGVATKLMGELVSYLEDRRFLTIRADVAADLDIARRFYERNGFDPTTERPGGSSRRRTIIIYGRELDTDNLFTRVESEGLQIDLGIRGRSVGVAPFFALDLNIYFDLVRERSHSHLARRLFGAALAHQIRLAIADEFVNELRRTSDSREDDPILRLAERLPRMPRANSVEQKQIRDQVYDLVFVQGNSTSRTRKRQAVSDANHLAHAILARASGFVTRDNAIIRSGDKLFRQFEIEILSIEDLEAFLPSDAASYVAPAQVGFGFRCDVPTVQTCRDYLTKQSVDQNLVNKYFHGDGLSINSTRLAITRNGDVLGCSVLVKPQVSGETCNLLIHACQREVNVDLYVDHLFDRMLRHASEVGAATVELELPIGQKFLVPTAKARGFIKQPNSSSLAKLVMGRPVTSTTWEADVRELRIRTGIELPRKMPVGGDAEKFTVKFSRNEENLVSLRGLESLLTPAMFVRPDVQGVIVPITKEYSSMLLGADPQIPLGIYEEMDASFLSRRSYANTPRAEKIMRPELPILFYESSSSGGVGGIVAVARIVYAQKWNKSDVPDELTRRLVVNKLDDLYAGNEVLLTSFENLFVLRKPVSFDLLNDIGAVDGANFVTAKQVSGRTVTMILDEGKTDGYR